MAQVGAGNVPPGMPLKLVHSLWVIHQHIALDKVQEVPQELQHYVWIPVFLWGEREREGDSSSMHLSNTKM